MTNRPDRDLDNSNVRQLRVDPRTFVIIVWYRPFDSNCTAGIGVEAPLKTRTAPSMGLSFAREKDNSSK